MAQIETLPSRPAAWIAGFNGGRSDTFATAPGHWPAELVDEYEDGRDYGVAFDETRRIGVQLAGLSSVASLLAQTPSYLPDSEVW